MKKGAFTLVELIVGITISMILMVSVGIFIGSGIKNITTQEKVIDGSKDFLNFSYNLSNLFSYINTSYEPISTASGYIFKINKEFDSGGFSYIGNDTLSGSYCSFDDLNPSLDLNTDHLFIKKFIPYEENGEDVFSNFESILSSTVGPYTSYQNDHVVKNSSGDIIIGKEVFGNYSLDGVSGTGVYLNSPTGLASNGNFLYISDTLNNRILAYDTATSLIYNLLDDSDGLLEPTGLLFRDNELYIANSGRGEILKYSSNNFGSNPNLSLSFSGITSNITNFELEFFSKDGNQNINSNPNFSFSTNFNSGTDYVTGSLNKVNYFFSSFSNHDGVVNPGPTIIGCTSITDNYYLDGTTPKLERANCTGTNTGSIDRYDGNLTTSLSGGSLYDINLSSISPNLSSTGSYYTKLSLYNGSTLVNQEYYPYFVQGDGNLLTKGDNTLEVVSSGLNYPTGLWWSGGIQFNEFLDGNYSSMNYFSETDKKLDNPLSNTILDYSSSLFSLNINYFKQLNCYNRDENVVRSFMLKKSFK